MADNSICDFARDKHLGALNSRTSLNELGSIYQTWADRYDEDCRAIGYVGPKVGAECLAEWVTDSKARILDVGAGTGMGGVELKRLGFTNVDALDMSPEMLEIARAKDVYQELLMDSMEPEKPLEVQPNEYDAVLCVGTFTTGHVKAYGLDELVRIVKSGGVIVFTLKDNVIEDEEYGFQDKMAELETKGLWSVLAKNVVTYHTGDGLTCLLCAFRVL